MSKILFAIPFINNSNTPTLLIALYDNITIKGNKQDGILIHYLATEVVRQYTDYDSLYSFIYDNITYLKQKRADTFGTVDVIVNDLNNVIGEINNFIDAYNNNIPSSFKLQYKLRTNTYNLMTLETILDPLGDNKILLNINRPKQEPLSDTVKLLLPKAKLPNITFKINQNLNNLNANINNNTNPFITNNNNINQNNPFNSNISNNTNNNNSVNQTNINNSNGNLNISIFKSILDEFKIDLINNISKIINTVSVNDNSPITNNKYKDDLIKRIINLKDLNENDYMVISRILDNIEKDTTNRDGQNMNNNIQQNSILDDNELANVLQNGLI